MEIAYGLGGCEGNPIVRSVETPASVSIRVTMESTVGPQEVCPMGILRVPARVPLKSPLAGRPLPGRWLVGGAQFVANPVPRLIGRAPADAHRLLTLEGRPGAINAPKEAVSWSRAKVPRPRVVRQEPAPGTLVTSTSVVQVRIAIPRR